MKSRSPFQKRSPLKSLMPTDADGNIVYPTGTPRPTAPVGSAFEAQQASGQTKEEFKAANPNFGMTESQIRAQQAKDAADALAVANGSYMADGSGPNQPDPFNDEAVAGSAADPNTGAANAVTDYNAGQPPAGYQPPPSTPTELADTAQTYNYQSTNTVDPNKQTVQDLVNTIQTNQVAESGNQMQIEGSANAIQAGIDADAADGLSSTSGQPQNYEQNVTPTSNPNPTVQTTNNENGDPPTQGANLPASMCGDNYRGDGLLYN